MNSNSYSFRQLDIQQLLSDAQSPASQVKALKYINKSQDLFNSHFCDEQFYTPIKKKSVCIIKDDDIQAQILFDQLHNEPSVNQPISIHKQQNQTNKSNQQSFKKQYKSEYHESSKVRQNGNKITQLKQVQKKVFSVLKNQQNNTFQIILIDRQYFIKWKGLLADINKMSLELISEQLNKKQLFIPIFQKIRYQQWQNSSPDIKFNEEYQPHNIFLCSINTYFHYLTREYPSQLYQVLTKITEGRHLKQSYIKSSSVFTLQFIDQTFNILKSKLYASKFQVLQKTLISKIRSLKFIKMQTQTEKHLLEFLLSEQLKIWQQIGKIEFIITLQQTQKYCLKRIKESQQNNKKQFWTNYRLKIKKQLQKEIDKVHQILI